MKTLEDRILSDGQILPGGVLKVDNFLNHQIDPYLLCDMAHEFHNAFGDRGVTKILTIASSGIAMATMTGYVFGCPLLFAKKSGASNISDSVYSTSVASFTHGTVNTVVVSKEYLTAEDKVLIVDDFLATGAALKGLIDLCNQAGAEVAGIGIAIEKAFQCGGDELRSQGYEVLSLARIKSMTDDSIEFC